MSLPLNVNGVVYNYPQVDDVDWGPDATDWASAVTTGMLQKAGGLFQLLAEVDFGTSFGVKSLYLKSRTANPADAGQIRLARADVINWRNQANNANLSLGVSSSDVLQFNGADIQGSISVTDTSTINLTFAADVLSADIIAGSIDNSLISASAAIAFSKLASLTSAHILVGSAGNVATNVAVSGDISLTNAGVTAIGANKVLNSMLAQMAQSTFKGRAASSGTGDPVDLTATQATAILNAFVGDSGSGGTKGLVPAPSTGDATKFLAGDGTWGTPSGSGDVVGPGSSTNNGFAKFDGTTGKLLKNSAATISNSDVASNAAIDYSKLAALTSAHILVGSAGNVATDVAVTGDISLTNGGVTAYSGTVPLNKGGTGQTTKAPAFDALSPMSASGDVIYGGASGTGTRLAKGSNAQVLGLASGLPAWINPGVLPKTAKTTTYAILNTDGIILCSGSAFTATLPTAVGLDGQFFIIEKTDSTAANIITVATTSSQTIGAGGGTSTTLNTQGESITVYSDGANWQIDSRRIPSVWTTFTPTGSWVANTTYTGLYRRVGDSIEFQFLASITGTPTTASLTFTLPNSWAVDTSKILATSAITQALGVGGGICGGTNRYFFSTYSSTTAIAARYVGTGAVSGNLAVDQANPTTFVNGDKVFITGIVPISGWNG